MTTAPAVETKACTRCGRVLPLAEFYRDKRSQTGHKSECRHCNAADRKRSRDLHENGKTCSTCRRLLPRDQFYPRDNSADGLSYTCKECNRARVKEARDRRKRLKDAGIEPEPKPEIPDGYKQCTRCKEILPVDSFGIDRKARDGRTWYCKPCKRQASRESYLRRKIKAGEPRKRWRYMREAHLIPEHAIDPYVDAIEAAEADLEKLREKLARVEYQRTLAEARAARHARENTRLRRELDQLKKGRHE